MSEDKPEKSTTTLLKWVIALLVVIILTVGIRLSLKSDWLLEYVREIAVEQASAQLNGDLRVRSVSGDLLFGITLHEIGVSDDNGEDLLTVDSLQVRYTLPSLLLEPYRLDLLQLSGVEGSLVQDQDSTWNVEKLIAMDETEPEEDAEPVYWSVNRIILEQTNLSVRSDMLPDGFLEIENLFLQAAAESFPDRWYGSVDELSLQVNEGRLPSPVQISMEAVAMDEQITLESLVINTGRTLLRSNAQILNQDNVSANLDLVPLSRFDLEAYLDEYPLKINPEISLSLEGDFESVEVSLTAEAGSAGMLQASAVTDITDPYILKKIDIQLNNMDPEALLGDTTLPAINYAQLTGSGTVNMMEPESARWEGNLDLSGVSLAPYDFDQADFEYTLAEGVAGLKGSVSKNEEVIEMSAEISNLFSDQPAWDAAASSAQMNLATWLEDPALESNFSLSADLSGAGQDPEEIEGSWQLALSDGRYGSQDFSEVRFSGELNPDQISGELFGRITESKLDATFTAMNWRDVPEYEYSLTLEDLNLSEFSGLEELPTFINGRLAGEGRSFDPENLTLTATAELDSAIINGEPIDTLRADFMVENETLYIENSQLESSIADAELSLRQNLADFTHPQNRLQFSAQIKDVFPFAAVLGVGQLAAAGSLEGQLNRNSNDELEFNTSVDLQEVVVDTVFSSERITGNVTALILENPQIEARAELLRSTVYGQGVQDLAITSTALISEDETTGEIGFELINDEESRLVHGGSFRIGAEQSMLTTSTLEFVTPSRTLSLEQPFEARYSENLLQIDSLRVQSEEEQSYLELWAPHVDSLRQDIGLNARNLDMGVLQQTLTGEKMIDSYLSGSVQFNNTPDSLSMSAEGLLSDLMFEDGRLDSLRFSGTIEDEWLDLSLSGRHNQEDLFSGNARVPFLPGDPLTFDEEFFDRRINGEFRVNETDINYWLSFIPGNVAEQTSGVIAFSGEMKGLAGVPEFTGTAKFREGRISGVPIDSVDVDMFYDHDLEKFNFAGSMTSRQERILDFDSTVPFKMDLREVEVILPSDDDSLEIGLQTNNFNLAVVNDFLDPEMIRQVAGRINGELDIDGTVGDLQPQGTLKLSGGSMRVVPAGIRITDIGSELQFSPDQVNLLQFSMKSGPGRIRADGTVAIENLEPGEIDISVRGTQFTALNTQEYNAIVDLSSNITGTIEDPRLEGSLAFRNGFVSLQNFGEQSVEEVTLDEEEGEESIDFYEEMDIDMTVSFDRNFFIRNRQYLDLEIELDGEVDLLKSPREELEMFGQLEGVRGYARPLGKNFQLEEAFVTFTGPIENPEMDVRTVYEPPQARADVKIYYVIEGTAQDPEFRFESEPQMELQDIFSYTVFGKPFYELESWEQVVAGGGGGPSATDLAMDVLLDRVELLASQRLGIDVVQIDNSRTGSDSNTSILTGWYLNRRTFFALVNEISTTPKTLFLLEYMLTENLELIITQGDDSRQGVDLRWEYDY